MDFDDTIDILEVLAGEVEWKYPISYTAAIDKAIETLKFCSQLYGELSYNKNNITIEEIHKGLKNLTE